MSELLEQPTDLRVVLITAPDQQKASLIGKTLVERRLCACVNVVPTIRSIYWWNDTLQDESESLLLVKTVSSAVPALLQTLKQIHPYELPEFVVITPEAAFEKYGEWARGVVGSGSRE